MNDDTLVTPETWDARDEDRAAAKMAAFEPTQSEDDDPVEDGPLEDDEEE